VLVYCPTGEVSFHDVDHNVGMDYARILLTEACDKIIPNGPINIWRVPDITSYGDIKSGVSAYMNSRCINDSKWEINEFAEKLHTGGKELLPKLRGPVVLVMPRHG
jgi:hypothetical protein